MAAVTAITVTNAAQKSVTITFTGGNDFNSLQLKQLRRLLDRLVADMSEDSTMASVPVVIPAVAPTAGGPQSLLWDATGHI